MSRESEFINRICDLATADYQKTGILASVTIAQAILESGWGSTELFLNANNMFGMKCSLSGNTWNSVWDGKSKYTKQTKEQDKAGNEYTVTADFRKYDDILTSINDHSLYLLGAMNGKNKRYEGITESTDPATVIQIIKDGGYATDVNYVSKIMRIIDGYELTQYDIKEEFKMSNSSLVTCKVMSPNHSGKRTHTIDRITPHCVVGQLKAKNIGYCFDDADRQASCNYGIGTEGDVCLIVDECNRSWCSSSSANDQRAVTIECSSDKTHPYAMNNAVYNKLIDLCVDICQRNGKKKLLWFADKDKSLAYEPKADEMIITVHRWFANKSCPGDWLYSRLDEVASIVTKRLTGNITEDTKSDVLYKVQTGAFKNKNYALNLQNQLKAKGYDTYMVQADGYYKVQTGAYSKKSNAEAQMAKLKADGFDAFITTKFGSAVTNTSVSTKKSNAEIAKEIYKGICSDNRWSTWGNGDTRVKRLKEAGYDPTAIQKEVNKLF